MNIVTTPPSLIPVGVTRFIDHPTFHIPDDGDDATKLCAFAAKGCYDSFGKAGRSNTDNQQAILEHRHGSVLEHFNVSLCITGITRGLSLELNRHRTFAISQRSTRYTQEEHSAIVLDPFYKQLYDMYMGSIGWDVGSSSYTCAHDADDAVLLTHFLTDSRRSIIAYGEQVRRLIKLNPLELEGFDLRKWARGKARNILPHGLETRGVWTTNLRGYRWVIESRSDRHAEPEIRVVADMMLQTLRSVAPLYFEDFSVSEVYDGIPVWKPRFSKV